MRSLDEEVTRAARSDAKVLITGETGVGKEVVAQLIHKRSARSANHMVTLNCAGLPDSLLESELFGHVKGSFTGAYRDKPGLLELAPNGTVFLDEVGEMSPRMQVVLLRFLETGEIQRVGADRSHTRVNVRLITATNRRLEEEVAAGTFREDLYFRLNVIRLQVPPLRERGEDIRLLTSHYLEWYRRTHRASADDVAPEVLDVLSKYSWPGNVRELKNVVERMVLKAHGSTIRTSDLPPELTRRPPSAGAAAPTAQAAPSRVDELISRMLDHGESFWTSVYPVFMSRDMTRADLRQIVQTGLEHAKGNYRLLVEQFNIPPSDYKRFLAFLRKHDCQLPFQKFRTISTESPRPLRAVVGGQR